MFIELDLSYNQKGCLAIELELPSSKLTNLRTVQIKNKLEYIPDWLIDHYQLESLIFRDSKLTDQIILNPFSSEPIFKTLREERLNYIPEEIHLFTNIRTLGMGFSNKDGVLEYLPNKIGNLKKLENLLLSNNQIKNLPESLSECENISWVSLYDNPLVEFPDSIYQLKYLNDLTIGSDHYPSIEVNKTKLIQLQELGSLTLNNCSIKEFPMEFGQLTNLYALDLSSNIITALPKPIEIKTSFPKLNVLRMNGNPIFERDYDFCNKWTIELNNYDIKVYFN